MSNLPKVEREATQKEFLTYLHSNRFMSFSLIQEKFFHSRQWCQTKLHWYEEKKLLVRSKPTPFSPSKYVLSPKALQDLMEDGAILAHSAKSPKVSLNEFFHDETVTSIRIQLERELKVKLWVTDFEMRSGITREDKAKHQAGELTLEEWKKRWEGFLKRYRSAGKATEAWRKALGRIPDGYLEGELPTGEFKSLVLEYVKATYRIKVTQEMVSDLNRQYPESLKLLICNDEKGAQLLYRQVQSCFRKGRIKENWYITFLEHFRKQPFIKAFERIKPETKKEALV